LENIIKCPCCLSVNVLANGQLTDYYVSNESFQLSRCQDCGFVYTNPRPDTNEIGKYYQSADYMSHNTSSTSLFHKLYRLVRNYMYKKKLSRISAHLNRNIQASTILDYGAASGDFLSYCISRGVTQVSGVEPDATCRKIALEQHGVFLKSEKELPDFKDAAFDVITLWHVLEHVHNLDETIRNFYDKLNEKGVLVISVPNIDALDCKIYKEYWSAYDVPRHLYHFNTKTISTLMDRHGFKLDKTYPLMFDSYYISLHSEWYMKTGKLSAILRALKNGFLSNFSARKTNNYSSLIYIFTKN
jgi:2-polyprenyl-3-methyl-5-hydroxy-6-metoxy-1,4-benzoquinol methylase